MGKRFLIVKFGRTVARVDAEDIMYILRDGERLIVTTEDREYVYYEKMEEARKIMDDSFFQPRDRCIVNLEHLRRVDVEQRRLVFDNGDEFYMGRDACAKLKKVFEEYLVEHCDAAFDGVAEVEKPYL